MDLVKNTVEQLLLKIQERVKSSTQPHKWTGIINMTEWIIFVRHYKKGEIPE